MTDEPSVNGPAAKLILAAFGYDNVTHLAREIGENRSALSLIFSGKRRGGLHLAIKFAQLTKQPAHVFLGPPDPRQAFIAAAKAMGLTAADLEDDDEPEERAA